MTLAVQRPQSIAVVSRPAPRSRGRTLNDQRQSVRPYGRPDRARRRQRRLLDRAPGFPAEPRMIAAAIIVLLIAVNALYVAAEFSAVSVRTGRIRQQAEEG